MYKHILLPTDGSRFSEQAAVAGIALAQAVGARVTAVHVLPLAGGVGLEAWAHSDSGYGEKIGDALRKRANEYLETIREAAMYAGVPCDCNVVHGHSVHRAILDVARDEGCDLIVMGSHGRGGGSATVLGSETVKAVTRGTVPVLMHQPRAPRALPRRAPMQDRNGA